MDPTPRADDPAGPPSAAELEQVLQDCIEATESGDPDAVDEILARQPAERAARVRRLLASLDGLGLVDRSSGTGEAAPFVDRLGEFVLLRRLGEGAMGVVFLARQEALGRLVALKVVRPELAASPASRARFEREAKTVAALRHPNIVAVHGAGEDQGLRYLAMELVPGRSLDDVLAGGVVPPAADVVRWGLDVARALECAHAAGVVHRDVKPSNIRIADDDGRAVLLDFGLARHDAAATLTRTGQFQGSPQFASPEQVAAGDRGSIGPLSDVYSLGATLYACLAGAPPFPGDGTEKLFHAVLTAEPEPLAIANPAVGRDLATVVGKAMAKSPRDRYASAGALAGDLEAVLAGQPIAARPPTRAERVMRWARRRPAAAVALGALLALVVTLAGALAVTLRSLDATRDAVAARERALTALREEEAARRLSHAVLELHDLPRQADELWPAVPERLAGPEGFDAWLERAEALVAALPEYRRELAALEAGAPPLSRGQGDDALAKMLATRASLDPDNDSDRWLDDWLSLRIEEVRAGRRWQAPRRFADPETARRYAELAVLVEGVPQLAPAIERVARRRAFAAAVERATIEEPRQAWEEAAAVCRGDPRYAGLDLRPQLGLVPLGTDPQSGLLEFAHLQTGDVPRRDEKGALQITEATGLVLVLVPGGVATVGAALPGDGPADAPFVDPDAHAAWESPPTEVELAPFFVSKYEMTQGQWLRVTGENPSAHFAGSDFRGQTLTLSHPVERVSWLDAYEWTRRLGLRLPTEAQWEYAARAGTHTPWWTGADARSLEGAGNIADRYAARRETGWRCETWLDDGHHVHAPVGSFAANAFGLHDVVGNVMEWCHDWYRDPDVAPRPGDGLRLGFQVPFRMARSGSYAEAAVGQRSSRRARFLPDFTYDGLGLRPARGVE